MSTVSYPDCTPCCGPCPKECPPCCQGTEPDVWNFTVNASSEITTPAVGFTECPQNSCETLEGMEGSMTRTESGTFVCYWRSGEFESLGDAVDWGACPPSPGSSCDCVGRTLTWELLHHNGFHTWHLALSWTDYTGICFFTPIAEESWDCFGPNTFTCSLWSGGTCQGTGWTVTVEP